MLLGKETLETYSVKGLTERQDRGHDRFLIINNCLEFTINKHLTGQRTGQRADLKAVT